MESAVLKTAGATYTAPNNDRNSEMMYCTSISEPETNCQGNCPLISTWQGRLWAAFEAESPLIAWI